MVGEDLIVLLECFVVANEHRPESAKFLHVL